MLRVVGPQRRAAAVGMLRGGKTRCAATPVRPSGTPPERRLSAAAAAAVCATGAEEGPYPPSRMIRDHF